MDQHLAQLPIKSFACDRLRLLLGRLGKEWNRCASLSDADGIHDFRVALRRFGEALRLFRELFPKPAVKQVRAERRQAMQMAGRTRDVDIARETFVYSDAAIPLELDQFLSNERALAEAGLRAVVAVGLASDFATRWSTALRLEADGAPQSFEFPGRHAVWAPAESAVANAKRVLPALLEEYCSEGEKLAVESVKAAKLHELRLRGKHLRYALEVFRPIYGQRMDELLVGLKESQTDLGEVSDCTATIAWLKEKQIFRTPEGQHLRSYLDHRASKGAQEFVTFWRDHWGLAAFREHWVRYLAVYAGRMPPKIPAQARVQAEAAAADA